MSLGLIDSHAHLDYPELQDNLEGVLTRAEESGVELILTIGCLRQGEGIEQTLQLVERHPQVYAALGVHPHDADGYTETTESDLREAMRHPKILAWGEIGLDYHYLHSSRDRQLEAFRRQIRSAADADKPIIIHMREAQEDVLALLREEKQGGCRGVFHCFTADWETAGQALDLGFYISFGGILTFPKAEALRQVAGRVPADRLLVETDSPYLAPVPFRGRTNEPARVRQVAERLALIRGVSLEEIAATTGDNFRRLFGISL